ncbi:hypothetical protein TSUD_398920, partial [Trifolium subterraneum]
RGFDTEKLTQYPMILEELRRRKWLKLNDLVQDSYATIALEFYANAYRRNDYVSYVRGKRIDYSVDAINALLKLEAPEECGVEKRRTSRVPTTEECASNTSELIIPRIHGVLAILAGEDIDVGRLISRSIKKLADSKGRVYGHANIINALCASQFVPIEGSDMPTVCTAAFTNKLPQQVPRHHQYAEYELAMGEWAEDISHHFYARPPRFPEPLQRAIQEFRQRPSRYDVLDRFVTMTGLETYIAEQRERAYRREQYLIAEFRRQEDQYFTDLSGGPPLYPDVVYRRGPPPNQ